MPYDTLPDQRIPYDIDGTVVYTSTDNPNTATLALHEADVQLDDTQMQELQDTDTSTVVSYLASGADGSSILWWFFPEDRIVSAAVFIFTGSTTSTYVGGSSDTANGNDGTWEAPSQPDGTPFQVYSAVDLWRSGIRPLSFAGSIKTLVAIHALNSSGADTSVWVLAHIYGHTDAGAMTNDLIFIDPDTSDEWTAPDDFGDQPLGTSVVDTFKVKNTSVADTATGVTLQCDDDDFVIAEDSGGPWVTSIDVGSLGPEVESDTYYVRCTSPDVGSPLEPRFARIIVTCDAGFFE